MKISFKFFIYCFFGIFLLNQALIAKDILTPVERAWLDDNSGKIIFAPIIDYPPFEFLSKGKELGYTSEIIALIEKRLNFKLKRVYKKTWKELIDEAKIGNIDVIGSIQDTKLRENFLNFTESYVNIPNVIITKNSNTDIKNIEDLNGKHVGIADGYATIPFMKASVPQAILIPVPNDKEGLMKLSFGEFDAFISDTAVSSYLIEKMGISNLKIVGFIGYEWHLRFATNKNKPMLNSIFKKGLSLISDKEKSAIFDKWISIKQIPFYKKELFIYTVGILILIILLFYAWNRILKYQIKEHLKKLKNVEQTYKDVLDNTSSVIYIKNLAGVYTFVNNIYARLFKFNSADMVGKSDYDLFPKDFAETFVLNDKKVLKENKLLEFEETAFFNEQKRYYISVKFPLKNIEGVVYGVCGILTDITERKLFEKELVFKTKELKKHKKNLESIVRERTEKLQQSFDKLSQATEQVIKTEKMAALGSLVAGVAHEINTPVGVGITGATDLIVKNKKINELYKKDKMSQEEFEIYLENSSNLARIIYENLKRAATLVKSFKQISIDQTNELKRKFNLKEYINETILSLRNILKKTKITVNVNCADKLMINTFAGSYSQIITNLIMNSVTHGYETNKIGQIDINCVIDEKNLIIVYSDDGKGISSDNLEKIFDPFFTTNRQHGGSGLGLNIIYNIVTQKLKGFIICDSEINKGVKFTITIPKDTLV